MLRLVEGRSSQYEELCWGLRISITDQGELKCEPVGVHIGYHSECYREGVGYVGTNTYDCSLAVGAKRESRIQKLFSLSKGVSVHQSVVRKPLNKDGKRPRTKASEIQHLVTLHVLWHKHWHMALEKQNTEKHEEAAEHTKLLAKRMKNAKGKCQEMPTVLAEIF